MKYILLIFLLSLSIFSFGQKSNEPVIEEAPMTEQPRVFQVVEIMPEFPGGSDAMIKFIQKNIMYPDSARKHNIEGKVLLSFVVLEDGSVADVKVIRKVAWDLDAEAIRIVKLMPKFKPGKQQGKPVRVQYNLPLMFKLS